MRKYIAFLRGVNVGGKNIIPMLELKTLFNQNGFYEVVSYLNSGNIIFSCDTADEDALREKCERMIAEKFLVSIPVTIVSAIDLTDALVVAPTWWDQDKDSKHNAIFIIPPISVEEVFKEVGAIKPEYEKVDHFGRIIFWSAPIKTFSRTRWAKVVGSSVYGNITIRNANTVKKLAQLVR